ncbi:MAG: hypothetical protein WBD73_00910 [Candidatus Acidiferrales bacterium]
MKKGKHTSGPWKVYHQELRKQFPGHKIIEVQDDHGNAVVQWSGFDNSDRLKKVHLANARLIAAAPDLLAAAQKLEEAEDFNANDCHECAGEGMPEECEKCFSLFDAARVMRRRAIAKATGR